MAGSINSEFISAAKRLGVTVDEALIEAKRLYVKGAGAVPRRFSSSAVRPTGWVPVVGEPAMVNRPVDAEYPERYHCVTVRVKAVSGDYAMCDTLRGKRWSAAYAIPITDMYPSDKPAIDPTPIKGREDKWAGHRVRVTSGRNYGQVGTVVRSGRGKCIVRLHGAEFDIAKDALTVVG